MGFFPMCDFSMNYKGFIDDVWVCLQNRIPIQLWQVEGIHHFLTKPYRNEPQGFPMGLGFKGFFG
jgi:hypothetical protein